MTSSGVEIALVAVEPQLELVRYLGAVGFDVRPVRTPGAAPRVAVLVWLVDTDTDARIVDEALHAWLGDRRAGAVVVSDRAARLRAAITPGRGSICFLAAPVFGWQLVDAVHELAR